MTCCRIVGTMSCDRTCWNKLCDEALLISSLHWLINELEALHSSFIMIIIFIIIMNTVWTSFLIHFFFFLNVSRAIKHGAEWDSADKKVSESRSEL